MNPSLRTFVLAAAFLLLTLPLLAQQSVLIKLTAYDTPLPCTKDTQANGFVCNAAEGSPVLVYTPSTPSGVGIGLSGFGYSALSFHPKFPDVLRPLVVEEIKQGEKILFSASSGYPGIGYGGYGGFGGQIPGTGAGETPILPPSSRADNSLLDIYSSTALANLFNSIPHEPQTANPFIHIRHKGGDDFEKQLALFKKNYVDTRARLSASLETSDFQLELSDGRTLECKKGKNAPISDTDRERMASWGHLPACTFMKCGPIDWNGTKKDISLLVPYTPTALSLSAPLPLVTSSDEGVVEVLKFRALRHPTVPQPLLAANPDYERYFEELKKRAEALGPAPATPWLPSLNDPSSLAHPMIKMSIEHYRSTCANADPVVSHFDKHYLELRNKIAQKDLIQLITATERSLTSAWLPAPRQTPCPGTPPVAVGKALHSDSPELKSLREKTNPQPITLAKATALFEQARQMEDIAWRYKLDGCYARAHLMARRFESQGVDVGKVWIGGDLQIPEQNIRWNFHVAPIVYVDTGVDDNIERYVIDPSIATQPLTVPEWSALMKKGVVGPDTYTGFPFPANASSFERTAIAFSSSEPYLQYDSLDKSEEKKLAQASVTMQIYKKYSEQK